MDIFNHLTQPVITDIGLLLNLIGSITFITPEIPWVRNWIQYGRLRNGRRLMETTGIRSEDTGFDELVQVLDDVGCLREGQTPNIVKRDSNAGVGVVGKLRVYLYYGERKSLPNRKAGDDEVDIAGEDFYEALLSEIYTAEKRLRWVGVGIFAFGFAVQVVADSVFLGFPI